MADLGEVRDYLADEHGLATVSAARLGHIRRGAQVTVAIRRGWKWRSVTGPADIIGPDDAADDYEEYDRSMLEDRRAAVFIAPNRLLGNY